MVIMSFLFSKININKDKILGVILLIDVIIIFILLLKFNFWLMLFDAIFSLILIFDIIYDIIKSIKSNNANKIQLLKNIWLFCISLPFDLIIFYFPVFIPSNIIIIKYLRIIKILKLIKSVNFIMRYQRIYQQTEKIDRVSKKINAKTIIYFIFLGLFVCGIILPYVENIKGLDIFYFICVTFSSVGYGDVVVSTMYGKIIAIIISVLSILGIGFLSAFFLTYVDIDQEKENTDLKNEVNELKGEVNNLKEQNEKIIELLKKELR